MNNLVVNWHITERCNYQCRFCFAKWDNQNEIWDSFDKAKFILDNINSIWKPSYRLNFVGGGTSAFSNKDYSNNELCDWFGYEYLSSDKWDKT